MKETAVKLLLRRRSRGQAMVEFVVAAIVAMIVLFIAIQFAALGRDAVALGEVNYQVARWATNGPNNTQKAANGNPVNSPGCQDVANLIAGSSVSPYQPLNGVAGGYIGRIAQLGGVTCGSPPPGGIGVAMTCVPPGGSMPISCATQRPAGTEVQIALTMDTRYALFLTGTGTSFLGIFFPSSLSNTQTAYTQWAA